jgi:hypothetical protein
MLFSNNKNHLRSNHTWMFSYQDSTVFCTQIKKGILAAKIGKN